MAGVRGLELANVIFEKPLKYWANSLWFTEHLWDPRPSPASCNKDCRNDICWFESSQPSHSFVSPQAKLLFPVTDNEVMGAR